MSNKKVLCLTGFIIIGMILFPTIYKIYKDNNDNKIKVVKKELLYQANNCFNNGDCKEKKVLLKDLYDNSYIKDQVSDPINKKYYAEDSYINLETKEVILKY